MRIVIDHLYSMLDSPILSVVFFLSSVAFAGDLTK